MVKNRITQEQAHKSIDQSVDTIKRRENLINEVSSIVEKKVKNLRNKLKELEDRLGIPVPDSLKQKSSQKEEFIRINFDKFYENPNLILWRNVSPSLKKLWQDQGLKHVGKIKASWLDPAPKKWRIAHFKSYIARNLFFQGKSVNKINVKNEYRRILESRKLVDNISVFKDRNVVMVAHVEKWAAEPFMLESRFGKESVAEAIRGQGAKLEVVKPRKKTLGELKLKRARAMDLIKNTKPPFTFLFDGHGGPNTIYLSDGQIEDVEKIKTSDPKETENTVKITVDDLVKVFVERSRKFGSRMVELKDRDIMILASCYNHTFIRSFYEKLQKYDGVVLPITMGMSEYNQYGYSEGGSVMGNFFLERVLGLKDLSNTKIGDVIDREVMAATANPTVYIPTEDGSIMQLVQLEDGGFKRVS